MSNLVATREALDRFTAELPAAGLAADRLRRVAESTRALVDQALAAPKASTAWADHNLAVLVAEGLAAEGAREAALALFRGVRRRLGEALVADPDDLATALALAQGASEVLDDPRSAEDARLVAAAVARAHAGPRLVGAAVGLVLAAAEAKDDATRQAGAAAVGPVREAVERVLRRLPSHPDVALDRVRLELLAGRASDGEERQAHLDRAHALLGDHEERFGPSEAARGLRARLLDWRARTGAAGRDVRADAAALLEAQAHDRTLTPKQAERLVAAIERAGALDEPTAARLAELVRGVAGDDVEPWRGALARLLRASGDENALLALWERELLEDPRRSQAAAGLADRLVRNLRAGLASPFESDVLERVVEAVPQKTLAGWSADDVRAVVDLVATTFGVTRAATLVRDRLLRNKAHGAREALWHRALDLWQEAGDEEGLLDVARRAIEAHGLERARLLVAEKLLERGDRLDEADRVLRPLYDARGDAAAAAHRLKQRLLAHPDYRRARRDALIAFEESIGVGTDKRFALRVIHTTPTYVLVEETRHPAPDVYEHRHLRTLVRAQDLPAGVHPLHLRKGDVIEAPLRGQDGDPHKDRETLRIYWPADPQAVRTKLAPSAIAARLDEEEADYGIGGGAPVALKVAPAPRGGGLSARLSGPKGRPEFYERAAIGADQLPAELPPEKLGKGKRAWGLVERDRDAEGKDGRRAYRVVGTVSVHGPEGVAVPGGDGDDDAPDEIEEAAGIEAGAEAAEEPAAEAPATGEAGE